MTEGRFELELGTGRPDLDVELRELGLPPVTPTERVARLRDTVTTLRELDGPDVHTPVAMAVRGAEVAGRGGRARRHDHVRVAARRHPPRSRNCCAVARRTGSPTSSSGRTGSRPSPR